MPPRRRPANEIPVNEAYARDRMTRLEQQMETLTQQFQIQDTVNLFDPVSVSAAHQRVLQVEKQLMHRSNSGVAVNLGSSSSGGVHRSSSSMNPGQQASSNPAQTNRTINSGIKCFGSGETGHRRSECKKTGKRALFADTDDDKEDDAYVGEEPAFDDTPDEEILEGDTGPLLIVRRTCLTPWAKGDEWH
ncbi:hypothetical protein MRB53_028128 [Persea americana]|uniref:Uncharacterized protein n=1 Tax=Persea americana TaxID=3435 RepID=A0ACC2KEN6_PERAE|nr:hypothetical protein MRB53_028128 [Persea americana]